VVDARGPATFDVEEPWKGISKEPVTVNDREFSGTGVISTCDFPFREG
jgi:hypothetical protein